jgi:hypothetical protein
MKAPPFTAENAALNGRKGGLISAQARANKRAQAVADANSLRELLRLQAGKQPDDDRRLNRVKAQADLIADKIDDCLVSDDDDRLTVLTQALARLWPLVTPTAGSLRPGRQQRQQTRPSAEPISIPPTEPPSVG